MNEYKTTSQELFQFIKSSPSTFHAIDNIAQTLKANGFTRLCAKAPWQIENGGKYYFDVNNSAIIAFVMPKNNYIGVNIVATHSDTPCFKIKENPEIKSEKTYTTLNVEAYGGMLCAPWFDRPLSIAGRVMVNNNNKPEQMLVNINHDLVSIVNLAIHMDREANKGKAYRIQQDMLPIMASGEDDCSVLKIISQELNINEKDILDTDLFLYNRMAGTVWGANEEFISAPRLDNLQCTFSALKAILNSQNESKICMMSVFDNEEVGSGTKQGALSTILADTINRIAIVTNKTDEEKLMVLANSSMVSADNGHAVHPNYQDRADKTNRPTINNGVLIKYSANQKYTTDAVSGAAMRLICQDANVPYQPYFNNSDMPGGSTLGNLSAGQVSVPTVDIGAAMLAMHSPYETCGIKDTKQLIDIMKTYFAGSYF